MADSNFRGPINAMGSLEFQSGTSATIEPLDGPSSFYQGWAIPDPRGGSFPKDGWTPGVLAASLAVCDIIGIDAIPQAASSTLLAAAQVITASVAMSLATVAVTNFSAGAASLAVGVPFLVPGTTVATPLITLDFGFTTGTTTANSSTVQVLDNTRFTQGQWITLGNVGNASGTQSLMTQVVSISSTNNTTITVAPSPATALGIPIGGANLWNSGFTPPATQFSPAATPTAHSIRTLAGFDRAVNPNECLARNLSVTASTLTAGTATILATGYDLWGTKMTELVTASGTTTVYGKKAFKYIQSAVPQTIGTTISASYSIGVGDVFGFPYRVDQFQHIQSFAGSTSVPNNVGFLASVTTAATNTTGDVRGTIQLSGLGGGTPISSVATSNNVQRLVVIHNMPPFNVINTTPNNTAPMFGPAQSTT